MTKVTYLGHSGFLVETKEIYLLFDYYQGTLPDMDKKKPFYVFVSHSHYDHFRKSIFQWAKEYADIHYILSSDIVVEEHVQEVTRPVFMEPYQSVKAGCCDIYTLRSTDAGVAFLVSLGEYTIYHAGDLNWWHWEEESPAYNEMMQRNYQYQIGKLKDKKINLAFVPVDPRQGTQYSWGIDWFMRNTDTEAVFPMHFWGKFDICTRLSKDTHTFDYRDKIHCIQEEGQGFIV